MDAKEIKHMVFSGGGHNILVMFGALSYLRKKNYINFKTLKTIDATSAGALLAFTFMLGIEDDESIEDYLINRPWDKVFNVTPDVIFKTFENRGLFNVNVIEQIMEPIMKSCGVDINITMKELYDLTKIDFTVYATEINKLELVELTHKTMPNERVLDVVYKSCSIPPLFQPIIEGDKCFMDGGVFANYPLHCFLEKHGESIDVNSVFGIKLIYEQAKSDNIDKESNITDYVFCIIKKLIQHIVIHREHNITIPNELLIYSKGMAFDTLKESIISSEERKHLLNEGKRYASVYYEYKKKELKELN